MGFKGTLRGFMFGGLALLVQLGVAAASTTIVGLGDSLMAGYQLAPGESFPERLESALRERGHDVAVTNAGVSGDTTSGGLARLDWSVPDDTDLVILELGANDMLRGLPPGTTEDNLDTMIARLKDRGVVVVLAGMLAAPNLGADFADAFNAIFPRLAEKHDVALIPFFMDGVAANGGLLLADGMHPNAEGVKRMVETALPVVEETLGALKPGAADHD
mgnify:FL=1|jgi:acyl-CoA thioesterase-1